MVGGECVRIVGGEGADVFLCRLKASQKLVALKLNGLNPVTILAFANECDLQQRMNHTGKSAVLHGVVAIKVSKAYMRLGMVSDFIGDVTTYKVQSLDELVKKRDPRETTYCTESINDDIELDAYVFRSSGTYQGMPSSSNRLWHFESKYHNAR